MDCEQCGRAIAWHVIAGLHVYEKRGDDRVYRTRCGCGDVERNEKGGRIGVAPSVADRLAAARHHFRAALAELANLPADPAYDLARHHCNCAYAAIGAGKVG